VIGVAAAPARHEAAPPERDADGLRVQDGNGVDLTLIRAMLALTPLERLRRAEAYMRALSLTPVEVSPALAAGLRDRFTPRELVVLASTIAQVNFWSRFNQGLGVPSAGFFDAAACGPALPAHPAPSAEQ
jgi:alkylhydroperoxidase family enzyme